MTKNTDEKILGAKQKRQKRLGQALRDNLLKRKAQSRAREDAKVHDDENIPSNSLETMAS